MPRQLVKFFYFFAHLSVPYPHHFSSFLHSRLVFQWLEEEWQWYQNCRMVIVVTQASKQHVAWLFIIYGYYFQSHFLLKCIKLFFFPHLLRTHYEKICLLKNIAWFLLTNLIRYNLIIQKHNGWKQVALSALSMRHFSSINKSPCNSLAIIDSPLSYQFVLIILNVEYNTKSIFMLRMITDIAWIYL